LELTSNLITNLTFLANAIEGAAHVT